MVQKRNNSIVNGRGCELEFGFEFNLRIYPLHILYNINYTFVQVY